MNGWLYFALGQVAQALGWCAGLVVLAPACYRNAWQGGAKSIKDGRAIDTWTWKWLIPWFHNPEDGDSGQDAIVGGVAYLPDAKPGWRAYRWSALRNGSDGLKYKFAWTAAGSPPYKSGSYTLFGRVHTWQFGFKTENGVLVPVLSLW